MILLAAIVCGALGGIGIFAIILSFGGQPPPSQGQPRLKKFKAQGTRAAQTVKLTSYALQAGLSLLLGVLMWSITGWFAAALLGLLAGWAGPQIARAPRRRQQAIEEIEAYSQWAEQIRDLVRASGSLLEAVTLSAGNAPGRLRRQVMDMAAMARTVGLPAALDWFASEMRSPYADRLVLGLLIAYDSGARVSEAFDSTARGMRAEVDMRRRNEVANNKAWTQVVSILAVTVVAVALLAFVNRGFFEPFGTGTGQIVLLGAGALLGGSVFWVLKLSETSAPIRLLHVHAGETDLQVDT